MKQLFNNSNRTFINEFVRAWCMMRDTFLDDVTDHYNEFVNSDEGRALNDCYTLCNVIWEQNTWFTHLASWRHSWLEKRYDWLDAQIMAMHVPNDINFDGKVSIADVSQLIDMLLGNSEQMLAADISGDGNISITDVTELVNLLLR